jgi:PAS domain S-box-containing protein
LVVSRLRGIGGDVEGALERINVPSYVIDSSGVIRWLNSAAERVVGDARGRRFTSVVAHEDTRRAREVFAANMAGTVNVHEVDVVLLDAKGARRRVEVSSVRLYRGDRVIGIFGQVVEPPGPPVMPPHPHLTPRQTEVLTLLEHGRSTAQIAAELHLQPETVRNHIKHILQALGAHSRLEAVAIARRSQLVPA